MEILIIILLILLKSDGNNDKLTPLITALLENKELLASILGAGKNGDVPPSAEEKTDNGEKEKAAPEESGKAEAIEKFLNSYFR